MGFESTISWSLSTDGNHYIQSHLFEALHGIYFYAPLVLSNSSNSSNQMKISLFRKNRLTA